ncbi:MAG: cytochrome c [Fimbriimonadaceae bacterium]|nr:cytochrome c [Fimbriimonadaceae bacterium]
MKRRTAAGAALAVAGLLTACGPVRVAGGGQVAQPLHVVEHNAIDFHTDEALLPSKVPQAGHGREVYSRKVNGKSCAGCHGDQGQPSVAGAPDFSQPDWIRSKTPLELEQFLRTGPGHDYGVTLTLQERWDVVCWCRHLAVNMDEVRETATGRFGKNCNVCHGNKGFGNGFLAPTMQPLPRNLTDFPTWGIHRSDQEIYDNIWYGVHWSAMPPWRGTLQPQEVWQIVDFIRAQQYAPPEN